MLERLPSFVGRALTGFRPGIERIVLSELEDPDDMSLPIEVWSPAFSEDGVIPSRCTKDGAGISPSLAWSGVPRQAAELVLLVEDADSPTPWPLVHAIVCGISPDVRRLEEGILPRLHGRSTWPMMGWNSFMSPDYSPPDPPPGHGPHRYCFQLFALAQRPAFSNPPGRGELIDALHAHTLSMGYCIGTYERD